MILVLSFRTNVSVRPSYNACVPRLLAAFGEIVEPSQLLKHFSSACFSICVWHYLFHGP